MKKQTKIFGAVAVILSMLFLASAVSAMPMTTQSKVAGLVNKNPTTWATINGAYGEVIATKTVESIADRYGNNKVISQTMRANVLGLTPNTDYTLVYYGFGEFNDVWNHVTCITSGKTSTQGALMMTSGKISWLNFIDDGKAQKIWVVKSSDLDCKNHIFTSWNPQNYLFETNTI